MLSVIHYETYIEKDVSADSRNKKVTEKYCMFEYKGERFSSGFRGNQKRPLNGFALQFKLFIFELEKQSRFDHF